MYVFVTVARTVTLVLILLVMGGCYRSHTALLNAENADYPFQSITYRKDSDDEPMTLTRKGDRYLPVDNPMKLTVLLKSIGAKRHVVQMSAPGESAMVHLYAIVTMQADDKSFSVTHFYAGPLDEQAILNNNKGFNACTTPEGDMICIDDLGAFIDFANKTPETDTHPMQILNLQ